jgi:glycosyltransferase involved in cell wall biosynthesis
MPWPVLLMARELDLGGSERQMALIAKALDRSKFEPVVGCFRPAGLRGRELEHSGVPVEHFPVHSLTSAHAVSGAWRLARFIRNRGIRLVHTFDYPMSVFALPVARIFTAAVAVSSQRSHRDLIPPRYRRLVRTTDRLASAVVVNCEFVRRHLEQDEGVPAARIRLCRNGIDLDEFHQRSVPRPAALPQDALVIGVVCALRPEKGVQDLLEAFKKIRPARALKLAIVGSGPMKEKLESLARSLAIADRCLFVPATDQVSAWLRAFDIFVLPSRSEAMSNALMEAMACGCCAVASEAGGNRELIRNGETGALFPVGDAAALATVLELLIENPALRRRLAGTGTRWIRENFSIRASAERMAEIYAELIERRARPLRP